MVLSAFIYFNKILLFLGKSANVIKKCDACGEEPEEDGHRRQKQWVLSQFIPGSEL